MMELYFLFLSSPGFVLFLIYWVEHPAYKCLVAVMFSFMSCLLISMISGICNLLCYLIYLIFVGGLMVVFLFFTGVLPIMKSPWSKYIYFFIFFSLFFIFSGWMFMSDLGPEELSVKNMFETFDSTSILFKSSSFLAVFILIFYLLYVLFWLVYILIYSVDSSFRSPLFYF